MNRLKLVLPTFMDKDKLLDYKREFIENDDSLDGTAGLGNPESFEEWYNRFQDNLKEETVRPGLVPATTFLAVSVLDGQLIGMIDIRHRLNEHLTRFGGHIGYSIRKSARNQGYGTEMLALALEECRKLHMDRVLITCDRENTASAKVMIHNGAILENEVEEKDRITQRYWIDIK